jgi:DNA polymerase-3 subunit gamma/tau
MTFYLKYRTQRIKELDIAPARESLAKIVKSGKVPHALLFCGPKGTGKTSAARIVAKVVNCESTSLKLRGPKKAEPCNKCDQCVSITKGNNIDVIELDAASHRGIDDVRILRDAVKLSPAKARKKVYIIDEAHMLTTEASNALLKTLEEPPEHVIFILATTNSEKLIPTIKSRTTIINFRKAQPEEIVRSLERIVKGEKIKIKKESLLEIAKASEGSFREAAKILEQLLIEKKSLEKKEVGEYLFKTKSFNVESFLGILAKKETKMAIEEIEDAVAKGMGADNLVELLLLRLRTALLARVGVGEGLLDKFTKEDLIALINLFSQATVKLKVTPIEQLPLEVAIIEWCEEGENTSGDKENTLEPAETSMQGKTMEGNILAKETTFKKEVPEINLNKSRLKEISDEIWKKILITIRPINTSVEALLRAARPIAYDGRNLTLGVFYRFHKERLEDVSHRKILEDVAAAILGNPVRVNCLLTEPPVKPEITSQENISPNKSGVSGVGSSSVLAEGEDKDIVKIAEEIFGN